MGLSFSSAVALLPHAVPVDPDAPTARKWIIDELSKAQYRAAQPTLFDRLSQAFLRWLESLRPGTGSGLQAPILVVVIVIVVVAIVAAFVIFGAPRLNRRSTVGGALFGEDDERDSASIRGAAEAAASAEDWTTGIEEMFRAIARGLAERTILSVTPGTTAQDFAARAAVALPAFAAQLTGAASDFDRVRYLARAGTEAGYRSMAQLERQLAAATPVFAAPAAPIGNR